MSLEDELMRFIEALTNREDFRKEVIGTDEVGEYTIDTCNTPDCGYETGICKNNGYWIIVQRYDTREQAELGHKIWMSVCAANPVGAYSVQTRQYEDFRE